MLDKLHDIVQTFFKGKTKELEAIFLVGPICSGKTSYRKEQLEKDYVVLDAADIYLELYGSAGGFGEHLTEELQYIGNEIAKRIITQRKSFVMEVMPDQYKNIIQISESLKKMGYKTTGIKFDATEEEAKERNAKRDKNDISSYFTENYHIAWMLNNLK